MKRGWRYRGLVAGVLLWPMLGSAKQYPTAECRWLHDRILILKQSIARGDTLGTREELARWQQEYQKKRCSQYDY
ncbi:hypothetical protein [Aeromonas bivalvium]|uniref:hypothetical protein n=1 Tax=Aeromonas bivalvium TaxID=440079 RepID=UPI003D1E6F67